MVIYFFAEHYPNPYKPYYDVQLIHYLQKGFRIKVFAAGSYLSTINREVTRYNLRQYVSYYPTTLKSIPKYMYIILFNMINNPHRIFKIANKIYDRNIHFKLNLMNICRMCVLPEQSPDVCYVNNLATASQFMFLKILYNDSKVIMYYHGGEIEGMPRIGNEKAIFDCYHAVLTNTNRSAINAISRGCDKDKIIVRPICFNINDYPDYDKIYMKNETLHLISIGRLSKEKGYLYAIEAVKELVVSGQYRIHYTIVGRGPDEAALRNQIEMLNLNRNIKLVGEKSKEEIKEILKNMDVLILPSIRRNTCEENQACVLQEAMLMKLLIIASNIGGVPESISEEMKDYLVDQNNASMIANMIKNIICMKNEQRAKFGESNRQYVVKNYHIENDGLYNYIINMLAKDKNTFKQSNAHLM